MSRANISVEWSHDGAPPEAVVEVFAEAALTVAVLDALLEDPELRKKALAALTQGLRRQNRMKAVRG